MLRIQQLTQDFERVWNASDTKNTDRKRLLGLLIEDVTLTRDGYEVLIELCMRGGKTLTLNPVSLPKPIAMLKKTPPETLAALDRLLDTHTAKGAARELNRTGHRNWKGELYNTTRVQGIRRTYGLRSHVERMQGRLREQGYATAAEMAQQFGVSIYTVRRWGRKNCRMERKVFLTESREYCMYRIHCDGEPMHANCSTVNKLILATTLYKRKQITLDLDATVTESNKRRAKFTYKKHRGYTPMIGHIGETGQVVAAEFREGNESANKDNLEFIQRCQSALPDGVSISHVRMDAAGDQAAGINHAMDNSMGFAIRAKMDSSVKETISGIKECDWCPLVYRDDSESDTEQVARSMHVMNETPQAFTLVVQRKRIDDDDNSQLDIFINSDDETVARGRYIYRAIATNLDELSDSEVVHWYNQRGEASENRLKELRSDFTAARLPCGDFHANAAWLMLSSIAYNIFALMRMVLPKLWSTARAPTVRLRLYDVAGQIVCHARQ